MILTRRAAMLLLADAPAMELEKEKIQIPLVHTSPPAVSRVDQITVACKIHLSKAAYSSFRSTASASFEIE